MKKNILTNSLNQKLLLLDLDNNLEQFDFKKLALRLENIIEAL